MGYAPLHAPDRPIPRRPRNPRDDAAAVPGCGRAGRAAGDGAERPVRDSRHGRRPARGRTDPALRLVPEALARSPQRVGERARAGPGSRRVPGRFDHAGLGRRTGRRVPRREGREPRHQRRHDARGADPPAGRRAVARPGGGGAADRDERPRGGGEPRDDNGQPEADPGRPRATRPADADRALARVPELGREEAPGRADQAAERALPRRRPERPARDPARDLEALRRRRGRRAGVGVPRPAASQRGRLRPLGGGAAPRARDARALRDRRRSVHAGGGLPEPVRRPGPHRLGLSPHLRGGQGERRALARVGQGRGGLAHRHGSRRASTASARAPTGASP